MYTYLCASTLREWQRVDYVNDQWDQWDQCPYVRRSSRGRALQIFEESSGHLSK